MGQNLLSVGPVCWQPQYGTISSRRRAVNNAACRAHAQPSSSRSPRTDAALGNHLDLHEFGTLYPWMRTCVMKIKISWFLQASVDAVWCPMAGAQFMQYVLTQSISGFPRMGRAVGNDTSSCDTGIYVADAPGPLSQLSLHFPRELMCDFILQPLLFCVVMRCPSPSPVHHPFQRPHSCTSHFTPLFHNARQIISRSGLLSVHHQLRWQGKANLSTSSKLCKQ